MKKFEILNNCIFAEFILEIANTYEKKVCVVLPPDEAMDLTKCVLLYDEVNIGQICFKKGYSKEYYITIDKDLTINVKPVYADFDAKNYTNSNGNDVMFFGSEVNSKISIKNKCETKFEVEVYGIYEDEDDDDESDLEENYDEFEEDFDEDDECGDCCCDCSDCPKRDIYEDIDEILDAIDDLLSRFED